MPDVLSQNEIDALLNALNAGEEYTAQSDEDSSPANVARIYDFRTANKFYKEQMRTLNVVFDSFAYLLTNKLTGLLHCLCTVEVISVEEHSFGEYNNSLPSPVILGVIEMEPFDGSMIMEMSSTFVYALISRLFGGAADYALSDKSFTEIEMSIISNIMHQLMSVFKEAWGKIVNVNPVLRRIESSAQFAQVAAMNEPVAIVTMNVKMDEIDGIVSICIPHYSIQPVAKQLSTVNWSLADSSSNRKIKDQNVKNTIEDQLQNTYITLQATFNETETTLEEILRMQVGDYIVLNHPIKECINVNMESILKFKGIIGTDNHKYAIQIAKIVKEKENIE